MKQTYLKPLVHTFEVYSEGNFCKTGGNEGDYGDPGPLFGEDDIYDGGEV